MLYVVTAFSTKMLADLPATIKVEEVTPEKAQGLALSEDAQLKIGHPNTAQALSILWDAEVPAERVNLFVHPGDQLLVCEVALRRLAEGQILTTEEVLGAKWRFLLITVS